jgi:hypothetical protein
MNEYPKLRTGTAAQYPAVKTVGYRTEVLRFVDGSEQRYRECVGPVRRWELRLDLIDEEEWGRLEEFFEGEQGSFGSFRFEDPWDGTGYEDCSFGGDELEWELEGESRGGAVVVVEQNRT